MIKIINRKRERDFEQILKYKKLNENNIDWLHKKVGSAYVGCDIQN